MNPSRISRFNLAVVTALMILGAERRAMGQPSILYFATNSFYACEGGTINGMVYRGGNTFWTLNFAVTVFTNVSDTIPFNPDDVNLPYDPYYGVFYTTNYHLDSGQTSVPFSIPYSGNTTAQSDRAAIISLVSPLLPRYTAINTSYTQNAWINLQDNDRPVTVSAAAGGVKEGTTNTFSFDRNPANTYGPLTIRFTLSGTASNTADYQLSSAKPLSLGLTNTITLLPGDTNALLQVAGLADTLMEGNETLTVQIQADTSQYVLHSNYTATMNLADDYATVEVLAVDPIATEGTNDTAVFRITRSGNLSKAIAVSYSCTGTAIAGVDYEALPGTVTIPAGVTQTNLTVRALLDANTESAETVVLNLQTTNTCLLGLRTNAVVTLAGEGPNPRDALPRGERYARGTGASWTNYSMVIPVDGWKGTRRSDWEPNGGTALYHFNATNTASQSQPTNRLAINTPIVSFGGTWGSALYPAQSYSLYFFAGDAYSNFAPVQITAYYRSNGALAGTVRLAVPNYTSSNDWTSFTTNAFSRRTNAYGLTTVLCAASDFYWLVGGWGTYLLTHTATAEATNYIYRIDARGNVGSLPMVMDGQGNATNAPLYSLEFSPLPANRPRFLDQPHFAGHPLPPDLWNKTPDELLNYGASVSNSVSLDTNACTSLDHSPEFRRHPILDQFVADLNQDPLALANYVFNEIDLTDAVGLRDDGAVTNESVNLGGLNRNALGVYLEGQGSPLEQCALLIYLLRQAGYPAVYVFPPDGGLKLLDTRISQLLRLQLKGAQDPQGRSYTTNQLLAVNYPWVAVHVEGCWVHLFPWLKDTEVIEGLDVADYVPPPYEDTQRWVRDYVMAKTNLMALAGLDENTPATIYPRWLSQTIQTNAPGISLEDLGMRYVNRRHLYARWEDFPRPTWVTNTCTAIESLTASNLVEVLPRLTNVFDTLSVEVISVANPVKRMQTPDMRLADLHNRAFYLTHTNLANGHRAILSLVAFQSGVTNTSSFTNDTTLANRQVLTLDLDGSDDALTLRFRCRRQKAIAWEQALDPDRAFLDVTASREVLDERTVRKGDLAAICLSVGKVSPAMLRVQAEALWNMERLLSTNAAAKASIPMDVYQGALTYLMGLSYYERQGRFDDWNLRLHKVMQLSQFAIGLSKIGPRRDAAGNLVAGAVDPIWPNVDMLFVETVNVGNGTARPDSGRDREFAIRNYLALSAADGSAQEHQILNTFFGRSNAVSTVRLLQLAQLSATNGRPGVVELNYYNYQQKGESTNTYDGRKLKDQNASLWASVAAYFQKGGQSLYTVAWMTPGIVSAPGNYFQDVGALVLAPEGFLAGIGANQRGGFADQLVSGTVATTTLPQWETRVDSEGAYRQDFYDPTTGNRRAAAEATATFDVTYDQSQLTAGTSLANPTQTLQGQIDGQLLNGAVGTFTTVFDDVNDAGGLGKAESKYQVWGAVADPVDTLTGAFYVDEADLTLPGPMPLQVRRNYSSHNLDANQLGSGWKLNYMPFLSVARTNDLIYAAEPDGSVLTFAPVGTDLWAPTPAKNPMLNNHSQAGIGSLANRFNARLLKVTTTNTAYYLTNGDGSLRVFEVQNFPLTNATAWDRQRPYLTCWFDPRGNYYRFEYGTNSTQTDYGQVRRIVSSSGNVVRFLYDVYGRIVEAYSLDGRRLQYDYNAHGDLAGVTLPDASEHRYEYLLKTFNVTNGASVTTNVYSTHLLTREIKPDGRILQNEYDDQRRVTNQLATVGADLRLVRNATFRFTNNFNLTNLSLTLTGTTAVVDFSGTNTTLYCYTNGLMRRVRDPLGGEIVQEWYEAHETNAPAYPRSLKRVTDKRGLVTEFKYDSRGNLVETTMRGDLRGDGDTNATATSTAVFNEQNLPTLSVNASGTTNRFFYTNTWLLARTETWPANAVEAQAITNQYAYHSVTNAANGTFACGLRYQELRAANSPEAALREWTHDARGFVVQEILHTGTSDPAVTATNLYNHRGELAERTDAAGRTVRLTYTPRGQPQSREVYDAGQPVPLSWEYSYYNDNGEPTWSDGPRYDPEDYVWRDYDGAGRPIVEIHWRTQAREDGTGVEPVPGDNLYAAAFSDYDPFGNRIRTVDARGSIATNYFDALGRLIAQRFYDATGSLLATNGVLYNAAGDVTNAFNALGAVTEKQYTATGQPKFQKNADGSTNAWRYYLDGRLHKEILGNGNYWETMYEDAARRVVRYFKSGSTILASNVTVLDRRGNVIESRDAEGNISTNAFDGLDRLKVAAGPALVTVQTNFPSFSNFVQQVSAYTYDASGKTLITANALGEKTVTTRDALGRPVRIEIQTASGTPVRVTSTGYAPDHHSVTVTNGTDASAIVATTFTDTLGHELLSIGYPDAGVREYTLRDYDSANNLTFEGRYSNTNGTVALWTTSEFTYDGLNRVKVATVRDGAATTNSYNALGNLTQRALPGGVTWSANYASDGRRLAEWDTGSGGLTARGFTNTYYPADHAWAGQLHTVTDGRGVIRTNSYDDFLRLAAINATGADACQQMAVTWQYDRRGLATNVTQSFASTNTGPATSVRRTFDANGLLKSEIINLNGATLASAGQDWNSAGRRVALAVYSPLSPLNLSYGYRADGAMTSAGGATFGYADSGLLTGRTNSFRSLTVTARDGVGRRLQTATAVGSSTVLSETLAWRGDGLPTDYTASRADFTDTRHFAYAPGSQRLLEESLYLGTGQPLTNSYTYDQGQTGQLGVLTAARQSSAPLPGQWGLPASGGLDGLKRVTAETNTVVRRLARGQVNGPATVRAELNNRPVSVRHDASQAGQWTADLELVTGTNTLAVYADHPSRWFTTNASSSFTVTNTAADTAESTYDGAGNVTQRVWRNATNGVVRTQTLTWDAFNRLAKVTERDAGNHGYNWQAAFDGLGRRARTLVTLVSNNVAAATATIHHYYDPQVEFLEVGVSVNGQTTWKLYGPDGDGAYGEQQGLGGLEVVATSAGQTTGIIQDHFGNVLAGVSGTTVQWVSARSTTYGPVEGTQLPALSLTPLTAEHLAWRGKWRDVTGCYYWGARPYDSERRAFLAFDPLGHSATPGGYAAFEGIPTIIWDPDGRLGVAANNDDWLPGLAPYGSGHYSFNDRLKLIIEQAGGYYAAPQISLGSRFGSLAGGAGMTVAGFVPWLGDIMDGYTLAAPDSSGLDRTLSGVSLGANAWTAGLLPNYGPIRRGLGMIGDAFRSAPPAPHAPDLPNLGNDVPYNPRDVRQSLENTYGANNVSSTTVPPSSAPNVALANSVHPTTGVPFDQRGFPVFDKWSSYDTRLPGQQFNAASYTQQMQMASQDLWVAIQRGEISAGRFTPQQLQQIQSGAAKIDGFTWHHHQDLGRMQLVLEDIHADTRHIGGAAMSQGR